MFFFNIFSTSTSGLLCYRTDDPSLTSPPLLRQYADPVADLLDKSGVFTWRLFRESCVYHHGNYVKNLDIIGRDLNKMIIIDNSPASYSFHPNNAVRAGGAVRVRGKPQDRENLVL